MLATPPQQEYSANATAEVINYLDNGPSGNFGNDQAFPTVDIGSDIDLFALEAHGAIHIPSAGQWTFGVNSDDGFGLELERGGRVFRSSFEDPAPRGHAGHLRHPRGGRLERAAGVLREPWLGQRRVLRGPGAHSGFDDAFRLVGDTAVGRPAGLQPADGHRPDATDLRDAMSGRTRRRMSACPSRCPTRPCSTRCPCACGTTTVSWRISTAWRSPAGTPRPAPAWDSTATAAAPARTSSPPEIIGLSSQIGLLHSGTNVLAIQALNSAADDSDFLVLPELIATSAEHRAGPLLRDGDARRLQRHALSWSGRRRELQRRSRVLRLPLRRVALHRDDRARIYYTLDGSDRCPPRPISMPARSP